MTRPVYVQSGLRIRSEIPLALPEVDAARWDVSAEWGDDIVGATGPPPGEVVATSSTLRDSWYTATAVDDGYVVRFRDCGQFEISGDLRRVVVRRGRAGLDDLLPVLLAGTVAAFLLTLRGETVLHGSAVVVDEQAIAFIGFSGGGKSTMAALLCRGGAQLLTDDVLTVRAGDPPTCLGGSNELRLRPPAAPLFDGYDVIDRRTTLDGRIAVTPSAPIFGSQRLAALVFPVPSREARGLEVVDLPSATALIQLLASPRVVGWTLRDVAQRDFAVLGRVVDAVPVYRLTVPWGPPFDASLAGEIVRLCLGRT